MDSFIFMKWMHLRTSTWIIKRSITSTTEASLYPSSPCWAKEDGWKKKYPLWLLLYQNQIKLIGNDIRIGLTFGEGVTASGRWFLTPHVSFSYFELHLNGIRVCTLFCLVKATDISLLINCYFTKFSQCFYKFLGFPR